VGEGRYGGRTRSSVGGQGSGRTGTKLAERSRACRYEREGIRSAPIGRDIGRREEGQEQDVVGLHCKRGQAHGRRQHAH